MSGDPQNTCCRLALLTDFTPAFLAGELEKAAAEKGIQLDILPINPNAWEAQVLDSKSELYAFQPNVVLMGCSGPIQWGEFVSHRQDHNFADNLLGRHVHIWDSLRKDLPKVEILQSNLGPFADGLGGTETFRDANFFQWQRARFNEGLFREMDSRSHVSMLDWTTRVQQFGTVSAYDNRLWLTAAHPFSLAFLPELAKPVINRLAWRTGRFAKVLVLDLDETLWGGVVGESGPEGIQIGREGMDNIFRHFQLWAKRLLRQGILLAVASHNEELTARQAFTNPEHALSLDDFAAFRANWSPKSQMIREISEELNIGLDAFCFLDNSAFERDEVRTSLPEVNVPELPDDPADWIPFLSKAALFETGAPSEANLNRTRWIQEESQRGSELKTFDDYDAYLRSLGMCGRMESLDKQHLGRAHQLVMRTNQFNLRTIRHSMATLEDMLDSGQWLGYVTGLEDRFGDYGWIGLILVNRPSPDPSSAFLDTWIMSCRVFERGMEQWTFNQLLGRLREVGISSLSAEFIPTAKNAKFSGLLDNLGFQKISETLWQLDLSSASVHETHIDTPLS